MADIPLITNAELIAGTPLGGNIDATKYQSVILETQVFVIENIIGTKLYRKILADYEANTLTGDYAKLHEDYIKPIIIHSVAAEYITIAGFQVANGGVFRYTPENAAPADKREIDYLANKQRGKADVYIERMQKFLCDVHFPEYTAPQDERYHIDPDKRMSTFGGWRLSGAYGKPKGLEYEMWKDILNDEGRA
jgi:hypothetical protein